MNILGIDPGMNTGLVLYSVGFGGGKIIRKKTIRAKGQDDEEKFEYLIKEFKNFLRNNKVDKVIIEKPRRYIRIVNYKPINTKSAFKVVEAYRVIKTILSEWGIPTVIVHSPSRYKGLPTKHPAKALLRSLGYDVENMTEHEIDATVLALFYT